MITFLYVLLAIAILLFMVLVHEFGHYVAGRILKFKIEEFSVGFGKAIISKVNKRGERISLRLFPLGGYCAFAGEEEESTENKDAFSNQKPWKRIIVFLAGVTFNFLTAIIFSFILLCTVGYDIQQMNAYAFSTESLSSVSGDVTFNYYVSSAFNGTKTPLTSGDVILKVNGTKVDFAYSKTFNALIDEEFADLKSKMGSTEGFTLDQFKQKFDEINPTVTFSIKGKDEEIVAPIYLMYYETTGTDGNAKMNYAYSLGFSSKPYVHTFGEALARAIPFAFGLAWVVLKSLWMLITFQLNFGTDVGGPITTIATIAQVTKTNIANLLVLIPLISANLAVFNILPFPALDGSHVVFTLIEWIRGKPINRKIENMIHTIGLFVLLGFVILVDILHFVL